MRKDGWTDRQGPKIIGFHPEYGATIEASYAEREMSTFTFMEEHIGKRLTKILEEREVGLEAGKLSKGVFH